MLETVWCRITQAHPYPDSNCQVTIDLRCIFENLLGVPHEDHLYRSAEAIQAEAQEYQGKHQAKGATETIGCLFQETSFDETAILHLVSIVLAPIHVALFRPTRLPVAVKDPVTAFRELFVAARADLLELLIQIFANTVIATAIFQIRRAPAQQCARICDRI